MRSDSELPLLSGSDEREPSDATTEEFAYDKLDLAKAKDREWRWTTYFHDKLRGLVPVSDPKGRITQMVYCKCGSSQHVLRGRHRDGELRARTYRRDKRHV